MSGLLLGLALAACGSTEEGGRKTVVAQSAGESGVATQACTEGGIYDLDMEPAVWVAEICDSTGSTCEPAEWWREGLTFYVYCNQNENPDGLTRLRWVR